MRQCKGFYAAVELYGWVLMRLAGAMGGLGKTAAPGRSAGEMPPSGLLLH